MPNFRRGRTAIIGVGAVTLLALGIPPASAHYVYQEAFVYTSSDLHQCVYSYAESSHGESGNGYMKGAVGAFQSWTDSAGYHDCTTETNTNDDNWYRASQNIAIRDEYFRLNNKPTHNKMFPQDWSLCEYSDWYYNQNTAYYMTIAGEMRGPSICGASYYGTLSMGKVNNGGWLGGSIWSGGHRLPASPSSDAGTDSTGSANPGLYSGVDNVLAGTSDGELATDGLINPPLGNVTIAGPDGNPVINPATGQPFLVDLNALNTPPTNIPGNVFDVATNLVGPTVAQFHLPSGLNSSPDVARFANDLGQEFYVVPTHVAAEALTGAP
ncbi:MAG: hypothetical protein QOD07_27 [Frankiaceae bacterium]|jgi:hypothetical protein|nr:hypothetical protein [Frankiaceae bacterium]